MKFKNSPHIVIAKIKKIPASSEPSIIFKNSAGDKKIIPISDIEYINRYKKTEILIWKVKGALYFLVGVAMIVNDYSLGPYFAAGGVVPFFFYK